jgi:hypothetical protein
MRQVLLLFQFLKVFINLLNNYLLKVFAFLSKVGLVDLFVK